jgi:hypothetical protein
MLQVGLNAQANGAGIQVTMPASVSLMHQVAKYGKQILKQRMASSISLPFSEQRLSADMVLNSPNFFRANISYCAAYMKDAQTLEVPSP